MSVRQQEGDWRQLHDGPQYLEGWKATITVSRDAGHADHWLTVAFATSDLTARGVDTDAYEDCSALAVEARAPVSYSTLACVSATSRFLRGVVFRGLVGPYIYIFVIYGRLGGRRMGP